MRSIDLQTDSIQVYRDCDLLQFTRLKLPGSTQTRTKKQHMHPHFELYFLLRGEVEFIVEENRRKCTGGDIVLARGGEYHNTLAVEPLPYDHCFFYFSEKSFPPAAEGTNPLCACFLERESGSRNYLHPEPEVWERMVGLIERLTDLIVENREPWTKYAAAVELISLVNSEWHRVYATEQPTQGEGPNDCLNPIVNRALRYINQNFRTIGGIGEIAAACCVSHSYLSRVFRDNMGETPLSYLHSKRLAYAKLMLLNGYDVTATCYYSGFSDYSHFIQVFKAKYGITPLAFQREHGSVRSEPNNPD